MRRIFCHCGWFLRRVSRFCLQTLAVSSRDFTLLDSSALVYSILFGPRNYIHVISCMRLKSCVLYAIDKDSKMLF